MNKTIEEMINKPYVVEKAQSRRYVCWHFCQALYSILGAKLPHNYQQHQLKKLKTPVVPCIVLFRVVGEWHSGVVWPDGLHFVHACPIDVFNPEPEEYIVRKDRLTAWPYNLLVEGFYSE